MTILALFKKPPEAQKHRLQKVLHAMELLLVKERASDIERDRDLDWEYEHMNECVRIARTLAAHRNIDPDLAASAVAVQNIGRILKGRTENHAEAGYEPAKQLLASLQCFSDKEIEQIATSVRNHSHKDRVDNPLSELAKDVDIYVRYTSGSEVIRPHDVCRLNTVQVDLKRPVGK